MRVERVTVLRPETIEREQGERRGEGDEHDEHGRAQKRNAARALRAPVETRKRRSHAWLTGSHSKFPVGLLATSALASHPGSDRTTFRESVAGRRDGRAGLGLRGWFATIVGCE